MNTTQTTTTAERNAVVTENYRAIRGTVANVLRRAGRLNDANVDDYTSAAVLHIMEYSLPRFDASKGLDLRKFILICAERHVGKMLRKSSNRTDNVVSMTTTGQDFDSDCQETAEYEPSDVPAGTPAHLSAQDAQGTAFALLMEREASRNLPAAMAQLTDNERALFAAIRESGSWGEVAKRMGYSNATVTRRWNALADKLRSLLKVG